MKNVHEEARKPLEAADFNTVFLSCARMRTDFRLCLTNTKRQNLRQVHRHGKGSFEGGLAAAAARDRM